MSESFETFSNQENQIIAKFTPKHDIPKITCYQCGKEMESNGFSLCNECIAVEVDITKDLEKVSDILFCKHCGRVSVPPNKWVYAERESRELMSICLKKLRNLETSKHRLIDAKFLWTEPHSRRTKLRVTIQGEAREYNNLLIQQQYDVEFFEHTNQCPDCAKSYTAHTWNSCVQIRQNVDHKKTMLMLEQLILKHKLHQKTLSIEEKREGIDLHFASKNEAQELVDFLGTVTPVSVKQSSELVSEDTQSGKSKYKFTFSVDIIPICREDLVVLPRKYANLKAHGIGQLCICYKVNNRVHLIDPDTLKTFPVNARDFAKQPLTVLASARALKEYIVLDVEPNGFAFDKFVGADVTLAKASDMGVNDNQIVVRTHLGAILHAGDSVMGYDLETANFSDPDWDKLQQSNNLPDTILVKKVYLDAPKKPKRKLRRMAKEYNEDPNGGKANKGPDARDYEEFLQELEEDEEFAEILPEDEGEEVEIPIDELELGDSE